MLKYSLGSLLIAMAVAALGCAAVANWSPLWAEIMTTATVAILLVALLVALVGRGSARTFAIGFAAVGAAYFLLTFVAPAKLRDERLATSRAIDRLFVLTQRANANATTTSELQLVEVAFDEGMPIFEPSARASTTTSEFQLVEVAFNEGVPFGVGTGPATVTGRVVHASPPREFEDIGHCLWTLFLALIGGVLAQVIQRTSRKEETPGPRS